MASLSQSKRSVLSMLVLVDILIRDVLVGSLQIGMVFVRCKGGISHSPLEHVSEDDVGRATAALYTYLMNAT